MKPLRAFFIPTSGSAVMSWRIQNFVEEAHRSQRAQFQNPLWTKELNDIQPWEKAITDNSDGGKYDPLYIRQFVPMIESGCQQADVIILQYVHLEGGVELSDSIKTKFPSTPVLVEIDDNILSVPTYNEASETFDPFSPIRARVIEQLKVADGIIVSTPHLKEVYSEFNENVYIVENSIDFRFWDKLKNRPRPGIRIGWAGGGGREGDVRVIENAIKNIIARHKDVRFVFVNGPAKNGLPEWLRGVPRIEHHAKWLPIKEFPAYMAKLDIDIGISPLVDSAFNRGKSNLKWLENSALGIPTVASKVGHYASTIRHGKDGFLAETEQDFENHLDDLIRNAKMRRAMGMVAKDRVRRDFNVEHTLKTYIDHLQDAILAKACAQVELSEAA